MRTDVLTEFGLSDFVPYRMALSGLGNASSLSAEASVDVAIAVGQTRVLTALATELAKVDYALYQTRVAQIQSLIAAIGDLNQQIAQLEPAGQTSWSASLDRVNADMDALEQALHSDLEVSRKKRDFWAVGLTAGSLLLAGFGGWYVFARRKKKQFT